jgi:glycosyltransferase involved in cell wall biosynthesis
MSRYFFYTGNAYPHKNLPRLIEAVTLLNKQSLASQSPGKNGAEEIHLKIASSRNIFTERLKKVIKRLGAEKYVELLGFVPDSQMPDLYKNSLALTFPSLSEGFGLPGVEAMEAGTLVLASDIPVFREIYGNAAIYFNPLDFTSIEKSMRNILEMEEGERKEKIAYAQKFAKRYSAAKMAKETLKIYAKEGGSGLRSG